MLIHHPPSERLRAGILSLVLTIGALVISVNHVAAAPQMTPSTLPGGRVGVRYDQNITFTSPLSGVINWSQIDLLPPGIVREERDGGQTLNINGYPTTEGSYAFRYWVTTSDGFSQERSYTISVLPMEVNTASLPNATVGAAYVQVLSVVGGDAPYSWNISNGQLPVGLTLSSAGLISGNARYAIPYTFTAKVSDARGRTASKRFNMTVEAAPLTISTASLANGRVGSAYSADIAAFGGSPMYRWSVNSGVLPPGLTMSTSGAIRGTPTTAGSYPLTMKVTDEVGVTSDHAYTIEIAASIASILTPPAGLTLPTLPPLTPTSGFTITTTSLPNGTVGRWYGQNLGTSGGTAPYTWNFPSGTMPPGVQLDAAGALYGTPSAAGTYTFNIEVRDGSGTWAVRSYTLTIEAAAATTPPSPSPTPSPSPAPSPTPSSPAPSGGSDPAALEARLRNLTRASVSIHALVKLPDDGNRFTQADSAVYYIGADGRRHAFPNERVYFTWYTDFSNVRVVSPSDLASIPLGANATYKPGTKMVKFTTDPKVYAVGPGRALRWVSSEAIARDLYGASWNRQIDDISDAFYMDYIFGAQVTSRADFNPSTTLSTITYVSDVLPL